MVKAAAQLSLFYNNTPVPLPQTGIWIFRDGSGQHDLSRYNQVHSLFTGYAKNNASFSYKNQMVWIKVEVTTFSKSNDSLAYLVIRNPHINFLQVGFLQQDTLLKSFPLTGDHLPFRSRAVNHTDYVFPIPANFHLSTGAVLILADKRLEQLTVPIQFFSEDGFMEYTADKNMLAGLIFGLSIFLFVFNLFLFWQMREQLFVFYGLYILMIVLYIMADYGYAFMHLFPRHPAPADFMRPLTISLATVLYVFFCLELMELKTNLPVVHKWMRRVMVTFLILLAVLLVTGSRSTAGIIVWQRAMQPILTLFGAANLVLAIVAWRKKIKWARIVVATTLVLWISSGLYGAFISGTLPDTLFTRNLLNFGFLTDICILAFSLSLRFKHYKEQSEKLLRKTQIQEHQIFKSVTDYQEKELKRLSSLLHDSVGARLSALRLTLENGTGLSQDHKINEALLGINEVSNEVRHFSHSLSPILLQQKGIGKALQQYVDSINKNRKLFIQFEMIGSRQKTSFRYELLIYNIAQELIQNIIKHANASEAIVQVVLEEEVVSIFAEDNGRGFDTSLVKEGLGFTQIRQLVNFVNGRLDIRSSLNKGTQISIEFFTLPDASTDPTLNRR
ncbi:sensor histidine kinase [Flavisolibacter nicotianae]|uniref:sensor histidine kinase n=1 Tax=Flavisolibacter nicotianae TaxID=2364882 RepID=UPI0013C4C4ED|nr:7TM diverse intracellular signaling domain-containing protein [Flavisolibacter nicotianae]